MKTLSEKRMWNGGNYKEKDVKEKIKDFDTELKELDILKRVGYPIRDILIEEIDKLKLKHFGGDLI